MEGLEGYGVDGIRLINGKLCLWLPEGNGGFLIFDADNAEKFLFCEYSIRNGVVDVSVRPPAATGVTVNGTDAGEWYGAGWEYDPKSAGYDGTVRLTAISDGKKSLSFPTDGLSKPRTAVCPPITRTPWY